MADEKLCEHGYPWKARCRECEDYHADMMLEEQKDERIRDASS